MEGSVTKNLYVGNLSWDATEEDVKEYFGGIGEVRSVNIIKDRETGRPRGFCFLEMENGDKAIDQVRAEEDTRADAAEAPTEFCRRAGFAPESMAGLSPARRGGPPGFAFQACARSCSFLQWGWMRT